MIRLKALGGLAVDLDGRIPSGAAAQRRPLCMLAVLACAGEAGISRDRLVALFWPESSEARARNTLKQTLYALRRDLGASSLFRGTHDIRLNPDCITSDIDELRHAAAREDHDAVIAAFGGQLLEGMHAGGSAELEQLIEACRAELNSIFLHSAEIAAGEARAAGDYKRAVQLARRLASQDPFNGAYALGLIQTLAAAGDRTGALQFARVYETLMREELQAPPDPAVVSCAEALRRGEWSSPLPPQAASTTARPDADEIPPELPRSTPARGTRAAAPSETRFASLQAAPAGYSEDAVALAGEGTHGGSESGKGRWWRAKPGRRALILGAALIGPVAVATILTAANSRAGTHVALSPNMIAVVPCEAPAAAAGADDLPRPADAVECDALIKQALLRWTDVEVVNPLLMHDRRERSGSITGAERIELARELGAGFAVLARITPIPGGRYIEASLHDVQSGRQLREHGVTVPANFADVEPRMNELLGSLLSYSSALPGDGTLLGTTRLAAWRALQRGQEALGAWDLAEARAAFSEALAEDSSYAAAAYWLAQVEHWIGDSPRSARRGLASRAVALSDDLPESERRQARALAHLASGSYVRACEEYDRLISTDSVNIVAWLGRADCHVQDNAVLPDSTSRTGWRFRSSRRAAMQSYERALSVAPTAFRMYAMPRFTRLRAIYPINPSAAIFGISASDPSAQFIAFPELSADSIGLTPIPLDPVRGINPDLVPNSRAMASQRAARQLRDLTALWVSADSARPAANEAHALALEENGEVRASLSGENALWHVRRALHLLRQEDASDTSVSAARLRVSEVRLLLKRGNFEAAHDSAAVILSRSSSLSASATREVLPLAALLGRVGELEALVRRAEPNSAMLSPQMVDVPGIQVAMSEQELLLTTITMGMPGHEIASRFARLERALELNVPAGERPRVRSQLLSEVFYLGLLVLPDGAEDGASQLQAPIMQVQLQLRAGERERAGAVVRTKLDEMRSRGSSPWPSEWLLTARIALAYGDSTAAVEMLDRGLAALPRTSSNILSLPHVAASIPAMAALRGRLGSVDGAAAEAVRWSDAAAALRRTADAPLAVPPSDAP